MTQFYGSRGKVCVCVCVFAFFVIHFFGDVSLFQLTSGAKILLPEDSKGKHSQKLYTGVLTGNTWEKNPKFKQCLGFSWSLNISSLTDT